MIPARRTTRTTWKQLDLNPAFETTMIRVTIMKTFERIRIFMIFLQSSIAKSCDEVLHDEAMDVVVLLYLLLSLFGVAVL
jgi:hypothetical protein